MTHVKTTPGTTVPAPRPGVRQPSRTRRLYGLIAEFTTPHDIMVAAERTREAGYKWFDCCTPFPVHGLDKAMGVRPTILPVIVFFCGLTGTLTGFLLQWFTNATDFNIWAMVWVTGYDFLVSGKPMVSLPAWIPVIFELTILFSAGGCVLFMLLFNGLPQWYHPLHKCPRFARATDDRFFLVIEARDPKFFRDRTEQFMESLKPVSLEELED